MFSHSQSRNVLYNSRSLPFSFHCAIQTNFVYVHRNVYLYNTIHVRCRLLSNALLFIHMYLQTMYIEPKQFQYTNASMCSGFPLNVLYMHRPVLSIRNDLLWILILPFRSFWDPDPSKKDIYVKCIDNNCSKSFNFFLKKTTSM
jgi:hypothetical protein